MKYNIIRTDKADEKFRDIIFYIAADSGSVERALEYLSKLENEIMKLETFPEMGAVPKYAILRKQGYRMLIIESHLAFYKIWEESKEIVIYAVVDARREYRNLI